MFVGLGVAKTDPALQTRSLPLSIDLRNFRAGLSGSCVPGAMAASVSNSRFPEPLLPSGWRAGPLNEESGQTTPQH